MCHERRTGHAGVHESLQAGATSCTNSTANFHVALFGFPEVSTASVSKENACSSYSTPVVPNLCPAINYGNLVHCHRI